MLLVSSKYSISNSYLFNKCEKWLITNNGPWLINYPISFFWLHINWWTLSFTDADFRGNVAIVIYNHSDQPFIVQAGSLMAYLICQKISCPEIQVLEQIEQTERGAGGFGSTGWNKHDISRLFFIYTKYVIVITVYFYYSPISRQ